MGWKRLPIGLDSFEKIRENEFYYADKTGFIVELLHRRGESVYTSKTIWQVAEYEYAESLF